MPTELLITKELLDEKWRRAKILSPYTEEGLFLLNETAEANAIFFAGSKRMAALAKIYLFLEETGVAFGPYRRSLSSLLGSEWISLVNLALEKRLVEGEFENENFFRFHQSLYYRLLERNQPLEAVRPLNLFFSLAFILREEMEKRGVRFPEEQKNIREKIRKNLIAKASLAEILLNRVELPWVSKESNSAKIK